MENTKYRRVIYSQVTREKPDPDINQFIFSPKGSASRSTLAKA